MDSVLVLAPAKINWTLDILSIDERGYHLLDMLMQRISLYDTVTIKKGVQGINLKTSLKWLPVDERNTAFISARLFYEATNIDDGCEIYIKKVIPSGAGLAGGSADAAAVLKGLNKLYDNPLSEDELAQIALKIGADVPFMLRGGLYRAQGIGEKLTKLPNANQMPLLLIMTKRESASTKRVYGAFDQVGTDQKPQTDKFIEALYKSDFENMRAFGGNVLSKAANTVAPSINDNIERLKSSGAEFVSMTGSGSVVFGVFKSIEEVNEKRKEFSDCWSCICQSIPTGIRFKEDN
jgi:4-diphosphocytidyl-2-C-methyl-D-erythritol kinase